MKYRSWINISRFECTACGFVYDEEKEDTKFDDLPDDWTCPVCGVGKDMFEQID